MNVTSTWNFFAFRIAVSLDSKKTTMSSLCLHLSQLTRVHPVPSSLLSPSKWQHCSVCTRGGSKLTLIPSTCTSSEKLPSNCNSTLPRDVSHHFLQSRTCRFKNQNRCLSNLLGSSGHHVHPKQKSSTAVKTTKLPLQRLTSGVMPFIQQRDFMNLFGPSQSEWTKALAEAERIVGYSTSFMSLRCLLSDELANVAIHMKKLVGTKHPLLRTAKNFLTDGKHSLQARGLIILLVSKAASGSAHQTPVVDSKSAPPSSGIYASQRAIAEISEMIHTAFLVHRGVVDLLNLDPATGPLKVMELGNKMAVLSGDFLLASACKALAGLRNTTVVELISKAIAHLTEASFMRFAYVDQNPVTTIQPDLTFSDWERYVFLSSGTLIGHSCRGALELANHTPTLTKTAFDFGKNIAWAEQLHTELQPFLGSPSRIREDVSLISAPVILYLEAGQQQGQRSQDEFTQSQKPNVRKLVHAVRKSSALAQAKQLCLSYSNQALQALSVFPPSDSRTALQNMVYALRS